jgi:hypothetical protein
VPNLAGLLGQRGDEMRVGMAEHVHRHPGGEIEVAVARVGHQPSTLASLEGKVGACIGGH